jgi:ABC-type transporter Mla maintaining outer membrane lipid asymmetry ATPase subunit MlaF
VTPPVLQLLDVAKDYRGLRPLRIANLSVTRGDRLAILGMDRVAAEVFVNVITGATLPDRGDVRLFGRSTADIGDSAEWLRVVDRFGIVSERAVLLEALTVTQNVAMPFTLEIDRLPPGVESRANQLSAEVGLSASSFDRPVAALDALGHARVRFARALALQPAIVVLEHPTVGVDRHAVGELATLVHEVCRRRGLAVLALTADREFAHAAPFRVLALDAQTGRLVQQGRRATGFWRSLLLRRG